MDKIILNAKYANSNQFQKIDCSAVNAGSAIADTKNVMEDVVSSLVAAALMFVVVVGINKKLLFRIVGKIENSQSPKIFIEHRSSSLINVKPSASYASSQVQSSEGN
jgi:hypothetical protein